MWTTNDRRVMRAALSASLEAQRKAWRDELGDGISGFLGGVLQALDPEQGHEQEFDLLRRVENDDSLQLSPAERISLMETIESFARRNRNQLNAADTRAVAQVLGKLNGRDNSEPRGGAVIQPGWDAFQGDLARWILQLGPFDFLVLEKSDSEYVQVLHSTCATLVAEANPGKSRTAGAALMNLGWEPPSLPMDEGLYPNYSLLSFIEARGGRWPLQPGEPWISVAFASQIANLLAITLHQVLGVVSPDQVRVDDGNTGRSAAEYLSWDLS